MFAMRVEGEVAAPGVAEGVTGEVFGAPLALLAAATSTCSGLESGAGEKGVVGAALELLLLLLPFLEMAARGEWARMAAVAAFSTSPSPPAGSATWILCARRES